MASSTSSPKRRRGGNQPAATISLPIAGGGKIKKSKSGKRRAVVLIAVNLLMAAHIAHWLASGSTITPLEPSEAMEFFKSGVINAGLIFFALAILSTLIFGRWLCGWGCHLVAIQDFSRWVLGKLKIKPKPARIGILAVVPLVACVYMFLAPMVYRLMYNRPPNVIKWHLTTENFWATFPPWIPAAATFLVCGVLIIYFMGSKGFCTYGCPYGAIFGIVDQASLWRIRVTDACRGCGHCTAVCSSNVRVHEEVRDYGMVVDPGCMKCLDCISVCPNDALYFGVGAPALLAGLRTVESTPKRNHTARAASLYRWLITATFIFASYVLFMWYDNEIDWPLTVVLSVGTLITVLLFKGKSRRLAGYSLTEELLIGVLFLLAMFAFRGLYGSVSFLFALGLAAVVAYLGAEAIRLIYKPNSSLHRFSLKHAGKLTYYGLLFLICVLSLGGFGVHAGLGQYEYRVKPRWANHYWVRGVQHAGHNQLTQAVAMFERALAWKPDFIEARENLAGMYCATGQFERGIEQYELSLQQNPDDASTYTFMARAYVGLQKYELADKQLRRAIELAPQSSDPRVMLEQLQALRSSQSSITIEEEVLNNVLQQHLGNHTVADLDLPADFLARAVDRIIRSSYRERAHVVARADRPASSPINEDVAQPGGARAVQGAVTLHKTAWSAEVLALRRFFGEGRPPLRGFRAQILKHAAGVWPIEEPPTTAPQNIQQAAGMVAQRLARDGLLGTLAQVIELLGADSFADGQAIESNLELLRAVGLPIDWLAYFAVEDQFTEQPGAVVLNIARRLAAGENATVLKPLLQQTPFQFIQSKPGFRVATESGEHDIGMMRLQITRGSYWRGVGAGGSIDLARQLVEHLPDASFVISIEDKHSDAFLSMARHWPLRREAQLTVVAEPLIVAQWAQDSGKAGLAVIEGTGQVRHATLVPRYASRREDGTVFIPGETFLADGLASAGQWVIQSPLLFQGGNLLAVREPVSKERILLIGESEIYRNTALGLTREQVLQALRVEFGVDRCVVLPAVSFHIDFDLTVRAHAGRLIAFVNDPSRAVQIILELGVDALESHGTLEPAAARQAKEYLRQGDDRAFLSLVYPKVMDQAAVQGFFGHSLAEAFSAGSVDSPIGNLQRFLLAMDLLAGSAIEPGQFPLAGQFTLAGQFMPDRHMQATMRSFKRREADRRALHQQLEGLGWKVVAVPSLAEAGRGINYLNGLHDRKRYFMPAYGGFYAPLDQAAAAVFKRELGEVEIIPILCGESQRRVGAVHCAASAYPPSQHDLPGGGP